MPVLITGAADAAAYRLHRSLNIEDVVFADQQDLPQIPFSKTKFIQIPDGNSPAFAHNLLTLCLDHSIDVIFPLRRSELASLATTKKLFEEYQIQVIAPDPEVVDALIDTSTTSGDDIVVIKDGMILTGQLIDENDLPSHTGLFVGSENSANFKLFVID
jgi:hypothetical protein